MTKIIGFGARLRAERDKLKLTRKQLAHIISGSANTIKAWELGVNTPSTEVQVRIEQKMGLPLGALTNDVDTSFFEAVKTFNEWLLTLPDHKKQKAAELMKLITEFND